MSTPDRVEALLRELAGPVSAPVDVDAIRRRAGALRRRRVVRRGGSMVLAVAALLGVATHVRERQQDPADPVAEVAMPPTAGSETTGAIVVDQFDDVAGLVLDASPPAAHRIGVPWQRDRMFDGVAADEAAAAWRPTVW